jgi:DNA-binding IclR family transcriptional regulator
VLVVGAGQDAAMAGNAYDSGRTVSGKVFNILLLFAYGGSYTLSEIARHTSLPTSTAHRWVVELTRSGILERTDDARFRAGANVRLISKHALAAPAPTIRELARRAIEDLAAATSGTTVRLGVLDDLQVNYVEKAPGIRPVPALWEATAAPLHATAMGKVLLAFQGRDLVERVIERGLDRYTPYTVTSPERLRRVLEMIRITGVAPCRREYEATAVSIAAPVFAVGKTVVAALELEVRDRPDLSEMQPALLLAARSLTRTIATRHVCTESYIYVGAGVPGRRQTRRAPDDGTEPKMLH